MSIIFKKFYFAFFVLTIILSSIESINAMARIEDALLEKFAQSKRAQFLGTARGTKCLAEILTYPQRLQLTRAFRVGGENYEKNRAFALKSYLWIEAQAPRVFSIQASLELGEMYRDALVAGEPNYDKARDYFEKVILRANKELETINTEISTLEYSKSAQKSNNVSKDLTELAKFDADANLAIRSLKNNEKEPIMRLRAQACNYLGTLCDRKLVESALTKDPLDLFLIAEKRIVPQDEEEPETDKALRATASLRLGKHFETAKNFAAMIPYYTYVIHVSSVPDRVKGPLCLILADHNVREAVYCLQKAADLKDDAESQAIAWVKFAELGLKKKDRKTAKEMQIIREYLLQAVKSHSAEAKSRAELLLRQIDQNGVSVI